jgi:hypothetical protein
LQSSSLLVIKQTVLEGTRGNSMPYPSEHAARLMSPSEFAKDSFRRVNNKFGPGIHAIFAKKDGETKLVLQAIRFERRKFSAEKAREWLKEHGHSPIAFESASALSAQGEGGQFRQLAASLELPAEGVLRTESLAGRDYWVAPVAMIAEGVWNGVLYNETALSDTASEWNGRPLMLGHPRMEDGSPASANEPGLVDALGLGAIFNSAWDEESRKLRAEAWFDIARVEAIAPAIKKDLAEGKIFEVSTGMRSLEEIEDGEWNGKSYKSSSLLVMPDHLAILPHELGACSVQDGAGVPRVNAKSEEGEQMKKGMLLELLSSVGLKDAPEVARRVANEISHSDLEAGLRKAVSDSLRPEGGKVEGPYVWIRDVFDSFFVYSQDGALFRRDYSCDAKGNIVLLGVPVEVRLETRYVPIASANSGAGAGVRRAASASGEIEAAAEGEGNMDRKTRINGGLFAEADVPSLIALSEAAWAQIEALAQRPVKPAALADLLAQNAAEGEPASIRAAKEAYRGALNPKTVTVESFLSAAPAEIGGAIRRAMALEKGHRDGLVERLSKLAGCPWTKEQLTAKSLEELEQLAKFASLRTRMRKRSKSTSPSPPRSPAPTRKSRCRSRPRCSRSRCRSRQSRRLPFGWFPLERGDGLTGTTRKKGRRKSHADEQHDSPVERFLPQGSGGRRRYHAGPRSGARLHRQGAEAFERRGQRGPALGGRGG